MIRVLCLASLIGFRAIAASAQDAANLPEDLRSLRQAVENQSRQIETLAQQIAKLAAAIEGRPASSAPAGGAASPPNPEEFSTASARKAELAQPHHVVLKGETLTSIARQYNLPLNELIKANKGINDRKIQIGQSILLPVPAATPAPTSPTAPATPTPSPESKPNP